jgi:small-conductance mechanosensitive channel
LKFVLRCWTDGDKFGSVRNALTLAIDKAFQQAGIQIPFAQTDVHLHWPDPRDEGLEPLKKPK